ncbi:recombinase family protein [Anaerovirgula multivorans]|nr:recombinase family protein [Anaerovirgula multivorans]
MLPFINESQAKIVKRIYIDFLDRKGANRIARELEEEGIPNWNGKTKWYESSIRKMLSNEKYKGDALLQKTYTVDFLTKKRVENTGEIPQYYVEEHGIAKLDYATVITPLQAGLFVATVEVPSAERYGTLQTKG